LNQDVSNWVVDWFRSRGKLRANAHEVLQIDYLQSGLLSSLEIVELVSEIEGHFGIQFTEQEMQNSRFPTIGGIAELVAAALDRAALDRVALDRLALDREKALCQRDREARHRDIPNRASKVG
jgi:acyl carrier protein